MSQGVEHLDSALRPSKVEDLLGTAVLLNCLNVRHIIVDAHLSPRPGPELFVVYGVLIMNLRVLGAAIVADPDVVACFGELQVHWKIVVVFEPVCSIAGVAVLDQHWRQGWSEWSNAVTSDVERGEGEAIVSLDLHSLPCVAPLIHDLSKSIIGLLVVALSLFEAMA